MPMWSNLASVEDIARTSRSSPMKSNVTSNLLQVKWSGTQKLNRNIATCGRGNERKKVLQMPQLSFITRARQACGLSFGLFGSIKPSFGITGMALAAGDTIS
ncbi:hypothetical protein FB451DRAFT_1185966 [Mycena latifolia]|nr:hypothetical protein FB451DRAFT_1185966 [Mycena latifolia]